MSDNYDIIVIGGGPGGYNCAIRCGQLGLKVLCVESRGTLGGTCLNVGCIPSKALLHSTEMLETAQNNFMDMGLVGDISFDLKKMMLAKEKTVNGLTSGIEFLFKKNNVKHKNGTGKIIDACTVEIDGEPHITKNIVIATGSSVAQLPNVEIDEKNIVSSTGALNLDKVPNKLVVIGGGVIGLELGSVWRRLGSEVTVIEYLDHIMPGMDSEIQKQSLRIFKKQKMKFELSRKVVSVNKINNGLEVQTEASSGGNSKSINADVVLVCIGRKPNTDNLGLDAINLEKDERGYVITVVYTSPEIASVGKTEQELTNANIPFKRGKFSFSANSRARANHQTTGFVKILAHAETDQILGAHIIGSHAGDLIAEVALAMEFKASSEDVARTCHAHPTITEAVRQAAMDVEGWAMQS